MTSEGAANAEMTFVAHAQPYCMTSGVARQPALPFDRQKGDEDERAAFGLQADSFAARSIGAARGRLAAARGYCARVVQTAITECQTPAV